MTTTVYRTSQCQVVDLIATNRLRPIINACQTRVCLMMPMPDVNGPLVHSIKPRKAYLAAKDNVAFWDGLHLNHNELLVYKVQFASRAALEAFPVKVDYLNRDTNEFQVRHFKRNWYALKRHLSEFIQEWQT